MAIVAAFLWCKHPRCSVSTMILNTKTMAILDKPTIAYFPQYSLRFKKNIKKFINEFITKIEAYQTDTNPITVEYKIVFPSDIPYMVPAKESHYTYQNFLKSLQRTQKKIKQLKVKPQLRNRLTGKALKRFKQGLRSLYLVSRKRDTNYEYHLWTVALHATRATYSEKLKQIKKVLTDKIWT